jgi:hypothetical protein
MPYPLGHGATCHLQSPLVCCTGVRICSMHVGFSVGVFCFAFALLGQAVPVSCAVVRVCV